MASIWFNGNYDDLSTNKGYQFKFRCEKCGNGYMSSFKTSALGVTSSALQAAAKEQIAQKARDVDWTAGRDAATVTAVACPACGAKTQGGKFCAECGASLVQKLTCKNCGAVADGSSKFCPECGKRRE